MKFLAFFYCDLWTIQMLEIPKLAFYWCQLEIVEVLAQSHCPFPDKFLRPRESTSQLIDFRSFVARLSS